MPPKEQKAQLHLTVWNTAHDRLEELAAAHDPMTKNDIAVILLYYGLSNARLAIREWQSQAEAAFEGDDWKPPRR